MVLRARADPFGVGHSQAETPTYANLIDYRANLGAPVSAYRAPTATALQATIYDPAR